MDSVEPNSSSQTPQPGTPPRKRPRLGRILRLLAAMAVVVAGLLLAWLQRAVYHRWVVFPRQAAAWQALRAQRQPVTNDFGWTEYRGVLHSHSYLSHDSQVPFTEILAALKTAGVDFICLSDHPTGGRADFDLQWRGLHEGKLFIPGFEMKEGIMPFGVASGVVLSNQTDGATLARLITENGGLLFYAHPEEPREWDRPQLAGMEIYNVHTDFKRANHRPAALVAELLLNQRRYPEQVLYSLVTRPTPFLQRWDELNRARRITGIAGNDCHQNVGWRGICTRSNTFLVEDTSPRKVSEFRLNGFNRPLLRLCFGPLETNRTLFHFQLDPYDRLARLVNTHVLAHELTEQAILASLKIGRAFVAFDLLADSSGFRWLAVDESNLTVMGEAVPFSLQIRLRALSPLPCRFTVLRDGKTVYQQEGRMLEWTPPLPGSYRVEAELKVVDQWVPWVFANPIHLE